jgi:hypothetical protein
MKNLPKIGELVVLNDLSDAVLWKVVETEGKFRAGLIDPASDGNHTTLWIDICYLQKPTNKQLANAS